MSWIQPFYGGTAAGQSLARFLNRLVLILELIFIAWHLTEITNGWTYSPYWVFWVFYPFGVLVAMVFIGGILGLLCRMYLAMKYGSTDPNEVAALGYKADMRRAQKAKAKAERAERKAAGTWKDSEPGSSGNDPYNIERNRDIFRKL